MLFASVLLFSLLMLFPLTPKWSRFVIREFDPSDYKELRQKDEVRFHYY